MNNLYLVLLKKLLNLILHVWNNTSQGSSTPGSLIPARNQNKLATVPVPEVTLLSRKILKPQGLSTAKADACSRPESSALWSLRYLGGCSPHLLQQGEERRAGLKVPFVCKCHVSHLTFPCQSMGLTVLPGAGQCSSTVCPGGGELEIQMPPRATSAKGSPGHSLHCL